MFIFFNDTATTEIYTLSLHDALPICADRKRGLQAQGRGRPPARTRRGRALPLGVRLRARRVRLLPRHAEGGRPRRGRRRDRKSTRLNSSHANISYAVFCLKKKMNDIT